MTERKLPPVGKWVPHDGGPRPVPEGTMCNILLGDGTKTEDPSASWLWPGGIVAFCVTEYPGEEETLTGRFEAHVYANGRPNFFLGGATTLDLPLGTCTTTIVNGKPKRIVWDADE
jgi:hypothetical protein